jgi:hypothetical protein
VNDYGLYRHHRERYRDYGRWLLAGTILVGWAVGTRVALDVAALAILVAFLAGGVVMNLLKEELSETPKAAGPGRLRPGVLLRRCADWRGDQRRRKSSLTSRKQKAAGGR